MPSSKIKTVIDRYLVYDPNPDDPEVEEIEFELGYSYETIDNSFKVERAPDGTYFLGYLTQDTDCPSPEEADAMGKIGTSSRRDRKDLNEVYQEALGLTSSWERKVSASDLMDELAQELDRDLVSLLRHPVLEGKQWWDRVLTRSDLKLPYRGKWDELFKQHKQAGDFGNPDAIMLDVYEHGGRVYHVGYNPSFPDRQWDCAMGGAVWVPDEYLLKEAEGLTGQARSDKMHEWARQLVEEMNEWMSGACYCVVTQHNDAEGNMIGNEDLCGGYIGSKWAEEQRDSDLKYKLEHYQPEQPVEVEAA